MVEAGCWEKRGRVHRQGEGSRSILAPGGAAVWATDQGAWLHRAMLCWLPVCASRQRKTQKMAPINPGLLSASLEALLENKTRGFLFLFWMLCLMFSG